MHLHCVHANPHLHIFILIFVCVHIPSPSSSSPETFVPFQHVNRVSSYVAMGAYHAAVEVHGREWAYGMVEVSRMAVQIVSCPDVAYVPLHVRTSWSRAIGLRVEPLD
jgi:hypothetical protein